MERLTLDEAIEHAKDVAYRQRWNAENTKITIQNDWLNKHHKEYCIACAEQHEQLAKWLKELKSYKEAEEQGLLVRLPCKVGDDVYIIPSPSVYGLNIINGYEMLNKIYHQHIGTIVITTGHWYATSREEYGVYNEKVLNDIAFGTTWFLTREEAEKEMKELKNEI